MKLGEDVDLEAVYKMNYYFCVVPRFEDQSNHPMIKPPHVHPKGERPERSEVVASFSNFGVIIGECSPKKTQKNLIVLTFKTRENPFWRQNFS